MDKKEKLSVYRELFRGRDDVFAVYWENMRGRKGYSPLKNDDGGYQSLTDEILASHMRGDRLVGIYPIKTDNTVCMFAVDFDDHDGTRDAFRDVLCFWRHLDARGWDVYVERSKSGTGYHLWGFLEGDCPAWKIRGVLYSIIKDAGLIPEEASQQSTFDRIFPNQDMLKGKGLGNLIALPLNGAHLRDGNTAFVTMPEGDSIKDQFGFLKAMKKLTDDFINAEVADHDVVEPGNEARDEPIRQMDRPGLARVIENCDFIKHCESSAESLPEPLWHGMIMNLASFDGSDDVIHKLSSPYSGYSADETNSKIDQAREALLEVGPHTCAKLATIGFPCQRNCRSKHGFKSPSGWGFKKEKPSLEKILEKVERIVIGDDSARVAVARDMIETLVELEELEQAIAIAALAKKTKFSGSLLKKELETHKKSKFKADFLSGGGGGPNPNIPLFQRLQAYKASRNRNQPFDPHVFTGLIFDWMTANGSQFYASPEVQHLFFDGVVYEIGDNLQFNSLLDRKGHLSRHITLDRCAWDGLKSRCVEHGQKIKTMTWMHTDRVNDRIYINLNRDDSMILELSPGSYRLMPNGANDAKMLLGSSDKMEPIDFDDRVDVGAELRLLKEAFIDSLACSVPDAYMLTVWGLCVFLLGYTPKHPLMKLSGPSKSGKTTASRLFSQLIYGSDAVKTSTIAANFTDGARNPFLVLDNIENRNLTDDLKQFLLVVSTGAVREKRRMGTNSMNVQERLNCLVVITGIEPFTVSELINRTYDIEFSSSHKKGSFMEDVISARIMMRRSKILSAFFMIMATDILRNITPSHRAQLIAQSGILSHTKDRTQEFFALMLAVMEGIWTYIPAEGYSMWSLVEEWLKNQQAVAAETEAELNPCLFHFDALESKYRSIDCKSDFEVKYGIKVDLTDERFSLECTTKELYAAFCSFDRDIGNRAAFHNPRQLGQRIANDITLLLSGGWSRKKVRNRAGTVVWRFSKDLRSIPEEEDEDVQSGMFV